MPKFGTRSKSKLETCHKDLQQILNIAIKEFDFSVIEGERNEERQNEAYEKGFSQVKYPDSKHNSKPSNAVDIYPYPFKDEYWLDGKDRKPHKIWYEMAIHIVSAASLLGIPIKWGGTFKKFFDGPHFQRG